MKSEFTFSKRKVINNLVLMPYDYSNEYIIGLLLDSCIRFYKSFDYSSIKNYRARRILCANSYDFKVTNNYLDLHDNYPLLKEYNFSKEVYIVDCESFFDVIEKNKLNDYLKDFYFESNIQNEISDKDITTKRFCSDMPKIKFKSNYKKRT